MREVPQVQKRIEIEVPGMAAVVNPLMDALRSKARTVLTFMEAGVHDGLVARAGILAELTKDQIGPDQYRSRHFEIAGDIELADEWASSPIDPDRLPGIVAAFYECTGVRADQVNIRGHEYSADLTEGGSTYHLIIQVIGWTDGASSNKIALELHPVDVRTQISAEQMEQYIRDFVGTFQNVLNAVYDAAHQMEELREAGVEYELPPPGTFRLEYYPPSGDTKEPWE